VEKNPPRRISPERRNDCEMLFRLIAEKTHVTGDARVRNQFGAAGHIHLDRHRALEQIVDLAFCQALGHQTGLVDACVSHSNKRYPLSMPIAHVHTAVIPINVAELVYQLAISWQTGGRVYDSWIQQYLALYREQSCVSKQPLRLHHPGRVLQLIADKEVQGRVDDGPSGLFRQFDPANLIRGNVVVAGAALSVKH
jgi:hypothetical protein